MSVESAIASISEQVKARVESVLREQGRTHADLQRLLGFKGASGYWKMYSNGTLDLRKVAQISVLLEVDPDRILLGTQALPERKARPYVEDRLDQVEREVRSLRNEMRKR
jgi:hypothetical protein